jgi:hypothetical protein
MVRLLALALALTIWAAIFFFFLIRLLLNIIIIAPPRADWGVDRAAVPQALPTACSSFIGKQVEKFTRIMDGQPELVTKC